MNPGAQAQLSVSLFDLRRAGPFVVADFGVQCVGSQPCDLSTPFEPAACNGDPHLCNNQGGLMLVDPRRKRDYGAMQDAQGDAYASADQQFVYPGDSPVLAWTVFPAPPAGTSAMDVVFPHGGPVLPNVPITDGPAPTPASVGTKVQAATPPAKFPAPTASVSTQGLSSASYPLALSVGSAVGSDTESQHRATITLRSDVLFRFAKSTLTPAARATLAALAPRIKSRATGTVQIKGYTDSIGPNTVNIPLSRARAAAVEAALRPRTPGVHYTSAGFGSADPVAPNTNSDGSDNPAGRALNRRVTIEMQVRAPAPPAPPPAPAGRTQSTAASSGPVTYRPAGAGQKDTYAVQPVALFRDGGVAILHLELTCHAKGGGECFTVTELAGTATVPPVAAETTSQSTFHFVPSVASGLYLTDPAGHSIYAPVYDTSGAILANQLGSGPSDGTTFPVWVYFPAPAASVTSMIVHMPGGKPALSIPLSAPPGPATGSP